MGVSITFRMDKKDNVKIEANWDKESLRNEGLLANLLFYIISKQNIWEDINKALELNKEKMDNKEFLNVVNLKLTELLTSEDQVQTMLRPMVNPLEVFKRPGYLGTGG